MRDYRFFFLAEAFGGLKTTNLFHVEHSAGQALACFTWNKKKSRANPALLFHVEQSPPDFGEGIVSSFQDQSRHDNQEQLAHKPTAMLQRKLGAD